MIEFRDPELARTWTLQTSLCGCSRDAEMVRIAIAVAYELASETRPILPVGMIADIIQFALVTDPKDKSQHHQLPPERMRAYEDHFLGKFYSDGSFERASVACVRYQGRDQTKALAYLIHRIQARGKLPAAQINPSVLRSLQRMAPQDLLREAQETLSESELDPGIVEIYDNTCDAIRQVGELLGTEDITELELGTALGGFGQRVALRQIMRAVGDFEQLLKRKPLVNDSNRRRLLATRLQDEDAYPVGGFTSISTKGTIESLLHSQLAFMEGEGAERPDLFDIKFIRDELLYYARDENQFLRQRRSYIFVLDKSLAKARVKDPQQRYQRLIYGLATIVAMSRKLVEWLSEEGLRFEIVFLNQAEKELAAEQELLRLIFRDMVIQGLAGIHAFGYQEFEEFCREAAYGSLVHMCTVSTRQNPLVIDNGFTSHLTLAETPKIEFIDPHPARIEPPESWDELIPQLAAYLLV